MSMLSSSVTAANSITSSEDLFQPLLNLGFKDELKTMGQERGAFLLKHIKEAGELLALGVSRHRLITLECDTILLLHAQRSELAALAAQGAEIDCFCNFSKEELSYFIAHTRTFKEHLRPYLSLNEIQQLYPGKGRLIAQNSEIFATFFKRGLTLAQIKQFNYEGLQHFFHYFKEYQEQENKDSSRTPIEGGPQLPSFPFSEVRSRLFANLQAPASRESPFFASTPTSDTPRSDQEATLLFDASEKLQPMVVRSLVLSEFAAQILKIPDDFKPWFYRHPEHLKKIADANLPEECCNLLQRGREYGLVETPHGFDVVRYPDIFFESELVKHLDEMLGLSRHYQSREQLLKDLIMLPDTPKSLIYHYPEKFCALCRNLEIDPFLFMYASNEDPGNSKDEALPNYFSDENLSMSLSDDDSQCIGTRRDSLLLNNTDAAHLSDEKPLGKLSYDSLRLLLLNHEAVKQLPKGDQLLKLSFKDIAQRMGMDTSKSHPYEHRKYEPSASLRQRLNALGGKEWVYIDDIKRKIPFILENEEKFTHLLKEGVDIHLLFHQFPQHTIEIILHNPEKLISMKDKLTNLLLKDFRYILELFVHKGMKV